MKKLVLLFILLAVSVGAFPLDSEVFTNIYDNVHESVVSLKIYYDNTLIPQPSCGTGFIITEDGYVMTNNHVVDNASKIFIEFSETRKYLAKVIYVVPDQDLAVIKIESNLKNFKPIKFGDSDLMKKGNISLVLGGPFGISQTFTMAMVSNIHIEIDMMDILHFRKMLQLDATLNPGNSGGPVFNLNGEVIGINFAVHTMGAGIAYCIPINIAVEYWEKYLKSLEDINEIKIKEN